MKDYVIVTDSSCDLTDELIEKTGAYVLQLFVTVEGEEPKANNEVDIKEFYQKLRDGKTATTVAASITMFRDFFEPFFKEGKDILYLGFSSGLSSTYNWGKVAGEELAEDYPSLKFRSVDTLASSLGEGLLVYLASEKKKGGATIDEVADYIESIKIKLCHWFTVDDLFFLKRGGRVSATTAVVGSMLAIKPVLHVDDDGHLIKVSTVRGRKASIKAIVDKMEQTAVEPASQTVFICHGDCEDEAEGLAQMIKDRMGVTDIHIGPIGPVIGAHSGPGTLAAFFIGSER